MNVLIALIDPTHSQHNIAHDWFTIEGQEAWATCPITENGAIRIAGNRAYTNSPGSPAAVAQAISELGKSPGHTFWSDKISLLEYSKLDLARLLSPAQVTDTYLLALAQAHGGQLATLDHRLISDAVRDGAKSLHVIR